MKGLLHAASLLLLAALSGVQCVPLTARAQKPFVIAVLPDTQFYSQSYPEIFTSQTKWIADNAAARNIKFVIHEGDITNLNNAAQWKNAVKSMSYLTTGKVPYSLLPGNHDMGFIASSRDTTNMNKYFPLSAYSAQPTFGGVFEKNKIDNNYHFLNVDGAEYVLISLEFGPRDAVLDWAGSVIAANPTKRAIITSHAHTYFDNSLQGSKPSHRSNPESYGIGNSANNGQKVWEKLIRKHANILMVLNGHMYDGADINSGRVTGTGDNGNKVYQMLADYQAGKNGGNGFLRLLTFDPAASKISVETFSPYINESKTDDGNRFEYTGVNLLPLSV
ncbi:hypothetical protein HDU86_003814 [Geranomyces michiganensis]|nr:hypothetical protein HDU86_003814 [Geranomyces michiganensis]